MNPRLLLKGWLVLLGLVWFTVQFLPAQTISNLVTNGSFELDANDDGIPDDWQAAGDRDTRQQLGWDAGFGGGRSARLECTEMGKDSPSAHAMICQVGRVGVQRGQWYRLSFRAKAEGIRKGVSVALNNTKVWKGVGLDNGFYATPQWQLFEFVFEATDTLLPDHSRLQFWFKSTGTLWLDDVELVPIEGGRQWFPQWSGGNVRNLVPNGGFECGAANWGSYNNEPGGWGNQLYQWVGEWLPTGGPEGNGCLKITLNPQTTPVFYFDYFQAVRRPVRRIQAAHLGWIRVAPGETLTLSVHLRSEPAGVPTTLTLVQAEGPTRSKTVLPTLQWERYSLTFQAERPFIFVAVGPDAVQGQGPTGAVWVDNVVLEPGKGSGTTAPRQPVESFLETPAVGNIFTNPAAGMTLVIRAAAQDAAASRLEGRLRVTDFFDRVVFDALLMVPLTNTVPGNYRRGALTLTGLLTNRLGFYRATWTSAAGTNSLRGAVIEPVGHPEGAIGMNHAYPWDFLVELAHVAGIRWWRDWSAKWHEVEKEPGKWDFRVPDEQIERVLRLGGQPLVLLPFPSSWWSSRLAKEAAAPPGQGSQDYEKLRRFVAQAPQKWEDFGAYAAAVARHYRGRVGVYHILNEPIYTGYSLPRADGYTMADYLRALETAYTRIKAEDPKALVVGGIGTGPDAGLTLEFVEKGGLRFADILDLHLYDSPAPTENHVESYAALLDLMRRHGGPKPVWITEYGCYADDDPACIPTRTGDSAMTRARWPSEQAAAEHLVKYTAITFTYGVRKIMLHAGSSAQINGPNEGGVFFEYGGAPRKMYPAMAVLNRLVGTPDEGLGMVRQPPVFGCLFRRGNQGLAVVWSQKPVALDLGKGVRAWDMMGNVLSGSRLVVHDAPTYLADADGTGARLRQVILGASPVP